MRPRQAAANVPDAAGRLTAHPPALQAVIDAARQEGTLDLVWAEGVVGGREGVSRLAEGLNRRYGLNLDIRFTPGLNMAEMAPRLVQEYQTGRHATTDVYIGADDHMSGLMANGVLAAVDWSAWSPNVRDPAQMGPQGMAVTFQTWVPGITYNPTRVSGAAVPRTMQDLLKPEYKGRVASTPYASNFDRLATTEMWGKARTMDFATRFADQLGGLMRCNEPSRIASGEFDLFALDCNQGTALAAKADGAPIEFTPATDVPVANLVYMAVPKNATHPAAAKLWIDYMLSREAQDLLFAMEYMDSHSRAGLPDRARGRQAAGRRRAAAGLRHRALAERRRGGAGRGAARDSAHPRQAVALEPDACPGPAVAYGPGTAYGRLPTSREQRDGLCSAAGIHGLQYCGPQGGRGQSDYRPKCAGVGGSGSHPVAATRRRLPAPTRRRTRPALRTDTRQHPLAFNAGARYVGSYGVGARLGSRDNGSTKLARSFTELRSPNLLGGALDCPSRSPRVMPLRRFGLRGAERLGHDAALRQPRTALGPGA